jgi:hypothetical protein
MWPRIGKQGKGKQFFFEKKNQKTFTSGAHGKIPAMACIVPPAQK